MNARIVLFASLLAVTAIALSGPIAETTPLELTAPAAAQCVAGPDGECLPNPTCTVAAALNEADDVTGYHWACLL